MNGMCGGALTDPVWRTWSYAHGPAQPSRPAQVHVREALRRRNRCAVDLVGVCPVPVVSDSGPWSLSHGAGTS